ncbi:MAG: hypothetical protein P4M00_15830 [Azospirillaceae bacterium]|nr:hypothetical protein [Azospirillaceae bacterium]
MTVRNNDINRARRPLAVPQVSTRDFLNIAFYYRWKAAAIVLVVIALGSVVAVLMPPTYRAEARLLTLFAGYYDMQSDRSATRSLPAIEAGEVVNVEAQILASPELHHLVVTDEFGSGGTAAEFDQRLRRFEDRFHIEKFEAANVIALSFTDSDPVRAAHILETLIARYFRQRAGVFTSGRVDFLVAQRDKAKTQLDNANAQLIAFQRAHGVVNIDAQIAGAVALNGLLLQRTLENDNSLSQDRDTLQSLLKDAKGVQPTIELFSDNTEAAHAADTMQLTLLQLEARRADLASRYLEGAPFIAQIDQQIADVRKAIAGQKPHLTSTVRTGHNTYYDTIRDRIMRLTSDVAGEVARKQSLEHQYKDSDDRLQTLIAVANQLRRTEIDRDLLADSFKDFSRQLERARIEQNEVDTATSTNVRIIQTPIPPTHRSNPPLLFIAASAVAAVLIAGVSILVMSTLRETFLSPEEIERSLGLPVLSAPLRFEKPLPLIGRLSRWTGPAAVDRYRLPAVAAAMPSPRARRSHIEYGRMISAIDNSAGNASKVVLLLAFRDDDGIQTVIQGLTEELERRSLCPLLVLDLTAEPGRYGEPDADGLLHWPGGDDGPAPSWVGVAARPGFSAAAQSVFTFHAVERRHIVIGRLHPGMTLPVGPQGAELFERLRAAHDYVIIAVPPASRSFVGVEAALRADATVLAIRAEATRKPVALSMKNQVTDAGGNIVGVAMTNRRRYIPSFIYRFL